MVAINKIYYPDKTSLEFQKRTVFEKFMAAYIKNLKKRLIKKTTVWGGEFTYFTCGQDHDSRNPAWEPFATLEKLSKKHGYDFYIVKDMLEEHLGRKLTCECQVLTDPAEFKRRRLMSAGVDFESGKNELEIL